MQKGYFKSDTYITNEEGRNLLRKLIFHNRLYFTLKFAGIVFTTRKDAKSGIYDDKAWEDSSYYIFRFI